MVRRVHEGYMYCLRTLDIYKQTNKKTYTNKMPQHIYVCYKWICHLRVQDTTCKWYMLKINDTVCCNTEWLQHSTYNLSAFKPLFWLIWIKPVSIGQL